MIFSIVLCVHITNTTFASGLVFENRENNAYTFSYSENSPWDNSTANFFIREIAKYNLTSLYNTSYSYHYSLDNSIKSLVPDTYRVVADLKGQKCTGDVFYRGFDISDVLIPEMVDLKLILVCGNSYIETRDFRRIAIDPVTGCRIEFDYDVADETKKYSIKIEDIRFHSTTEAQVQFNKRINQIDCYFAAAQVIENAIHEINQANVGRNNLIESYFRIRELERIYETVSAEYFIVELDIPHNDIAGFFQKLTNFKNQLARFTQYFSFILNTANSVCINKSINYYAGIFADESAKNILLSQTVSHTLSGYFKKLGLITYSPSDIKRYKNELREIILKTRFAEYSDHLVNDFISEVFNVFILNASNLINDQNYIAALGVLNNAKAFYHATRGRNLPVEHIILTSRANYGIYDSYLKIINKAFELENFEMAENYVVKALAFQKENRSSIISDHYLTGVSQKLIGFYIEKGNRLNEDGEFESAIGCFDHARGISKKINRYNFKYEIDHGLICARNGYYRNLLEQARTNVESGNYLQAKLLIHKASDLFEANPGQITALSAHNSLMSFINQYTYCELMEEGKLLLESGNYHFAYEKLLAAADLHDRSGFEFDFELASLFKVSAMPVLINLCDIAEVKVRKDQLDDARHIYDQCLQLQSEYGLAYEGILQEQLTRLNNQIFEKQCEYNSLEFNKVIETFWIHVKIGDYISAVEILTGAEKISTDHYYCDFDDNYIHELKSKYSPLADYQHLIRRSKEALIVHDYPQFMELFTRMESLSSGNRMIRKEIEPVPLSGFFSVKKNMALLKPFFEFTDAQKNYEIGFKMLRILEKSQISVAYTRSVQKKLGSLMAKSNKKMDSDSELAALVDEYIADKVYYKYFYRACNRFPMNLSINKIPKKIAWFQDRMCILATCSEQVNAK